MYEALKEAKKADEDFDYQCERHPRCPHCGKTFDIERNEAWELYNEGDHEVECDNCEKEFSVAVVATFTFSTDEQPDDDDAC